MIQISGMPFQQDSGLAIGSVEKIILQRIQKVPVYYSYHSIHELLFDLKLRKNIIESSKRMDQGEAQFRTFQQSRCNPKYWKLTTAGGFLLKFGARPSDAVQDIFLNSSLYAFDCATASVIILYHALLKTIGAHSFNLLFQNIYLYSWNTDPNLGLYTFYSNHFIPGDIVYFNNPDFNPSTHWFRGVNAVVFEDGRFWGHGFGIRTAEEMIKILNKKRITGSLQTAYLTPLVTRPSMNYLAKWFDP
jgi:protein-glutamine gamma-glutamyltransferase